MVFNTAFIEIYDGKVLAVSVMQSEYIHHNKYRTTSCDITVVKMSYKGMSYSLLELFNFKLSVIS